MKYLSTEMVADRLSMSPKQIRRYLKSGKLPSIKIGKLRRIAEADLEKFLDDRKHRGDDWQSRKTLSVA